MDFFKLPLGKLLLAGTSSLAICMSSTSALAEDQLQDPIFDTVWSGPYVGVHIGAGDARTGGHFDDLFVDMDLSPLSEMGASGGAQVGWNFDVNGWVLGAEADISAVGFGNSAADKLGDTYTFDTDYMATVRARAGKPFGNSLVYVTGGVAYFDGDLSLVSGQHTVSVSDYGVVLGGGVATRVAPNVSFAVEGFWTRFDSSVDLPNVVSAGTGDSFDLDETYTARFALNYHFGNRAGSTATFGKKSDYHWDGFHFGGQFGLGGQRTQGVWDSDISSVDLAGVSDPGAIYGAQVGWSHVRGDWLLGVEADISGVDWSGSSGPDIEDDTHSLKTNYVTMLRGRVGRISGNSMIYATGGAAYIDTELTTEENGGSSGDRTDIDAWGGVIGAGVETFVTPRMSIKSEALYLIFDETDDLIGLPDRSSGDSFSLDDGFMFRVGLNWNL